MNKTLQDFGSLQKWSQNMGGVFSVSDVSNMLNESSPVGLNRRIRRLEENSALSRFIRGYYTSGDFDARVLSARINTNSYISMGTVLADELIIGSVPARTLYVVKTGRNRVYRKGAVTLRYLGIAPHLFFGFKNRDGINIATPEKAFLDTLYFYQKGQRFSFDIYSDIDVSRLDRAAITGYLKHFRNPRFISFVKGYLNNGPQ
jgi:predicted transcriptional regulator of viral defense system